MFFKIIIFEYLYQTKEVDHYISYLSLFVLFFKTIVFHLLIQSIIYSLIMFIFHLPPSLGI